MNILIHSIIFVKKKQINMKNIKMKYIFVNNKIDIQI